MKEYKKMEKKFLFRKTISVLKKKRKMFSLFMKTFSQKWKTFSKFSMDEP